MCLIPEGWNGHLSNYQAACQSATSHKHSSLILLVLVRGVMEHFTPYGSLDLGWFFLHGASCTHLLDNLINIDNQMLCLIILNALSCMEAYFSQCDETLCKSLWSESFSKWFSRRKSFANFEILQFYIFLVPFYWDTNSLFWDGNSFFESLIIF